MATLTIRDLDDEVRARLRVQTADNSRSMEAESRLLLLDTNVVSELLRQLERAVLRWVGALDAVCRQHGATLATRNMRDFTGTGVRLVDPWDAAL